MNILVFGSDGFVGRHVVENLSEKHNVLKASRKLPRGTGSIYADMLKPDTIKDALVAAKPDVVVNCAGVVENSDAAKQNPVFTKNLLEAITASELLVKRVIISGSAAEYGQVATEDLPVDEETPLNAHSGYGLYKLQETSLALEYSKNHQLNIIVARIFNPIGPGMHPKFLIPRILDQCQRVINGELTSIEVSRLDALRDYVDVRDVAGAVKLLVEGEPKESIYNIGSGTATSNGMLTELVAALSGILEPSIIETARNPEVTVANRADISRIKNEFGWEPHFSLEETIKDIINGTKQ